MKLSSIRQHDRLVVGWSGIASKGKRRQWLRGRAGKRLRCAVVWIPTVV